MGRCFQNTLGQQLCHSSFPSIPQLFHFTSFIPTADTPLAYGSVLLIVPGGMVLPTAEDLKIPTENHLRTGLNTIMSTVPVNTCHCIIYYIIFSLSTLSRLNGSCFSYYYKLFHFLSSCLPLAGCTPIKIFISDANLLK